MTTPGSDNAFFGRRNILAMFVGSGVFVIAYALLALFGANVASSLLFVSMPLVSAVVVGMMAPTRKMIFGSCYFSLAINLILGPFMLAEGLFCIIMAAPIFALVTALGAFFAYAVRPDTTEPRRRLTKPPVQLMLLAAGLIGTGSVWDEIVLRRGAPIETVRTEVEIAADRGEVWQRLTFDRAPAAKVPLWLRPWVAQPERFSFGATGVGAVRYTDFGPPHYGDDADAIRNKLVYDVTEWRVDEACTFALKENHSRMRRWLDLIDTRVQLADAAGGKTTVVLTTRYRRRIGPSIYFTPFLNAAVGGMQEMLGEELKAGATAVAMRDLNSNGLKILKNTKEEQ